MVWQCKGKCHDLKKVPRKEDGIKICDPCEYAMISPARYCPCCSKKFRTRKHSKKANQRRLEESSRIM